MNNKKFLEGLIEGDNPNYQVCNTCNTDYPAHDRRWRCQCGGLLDIRFKPRFPLDVITSRKPTMWRYREAIPILNSACIVSLDEGFTPLLEVTFGQHTVLIKQDQLFSTGSYKDRGASVLISRVKELGIQKVVEDSSGNAGSAIAAYCARAGIACDIYVPAATSPAKIAQIQHYGARLFPIPGSREDTASAVLHAAQTDYYASHSWNPFFFHGTKTIAFEICEQLNWQAPDTIILPVGNGTLLLGASLGFNELLCAGVISRLPRIIGVQAAHCAPLYQAFKENSTELPMITAQKTIAEGIAIAAPIRGKQILNAIRTSGGDILAVGEEEIMTALTEMCRTGFYIEPTTAATVAGIKKYLMQKSVTYSECIVSVFTGHGLKTGGKDL